MKQTVYQTVLDYEKVRTHLAAHPQDKEKILKCVDEIKGDYRFSLVGAASSFIDKTFMRLYDGVKLKTPSEFNLEKLQEQYHIVLVPNHQSHADYIALQYLFYKYYHSAVYIAAGINLNIFPIGDLFKRCGAFFIRRKFDDEAYKVAFQGYIYYLLKSNKLVEFFFEGGRTRTGKLLPPRYGLFSMLLDAHTKFNDNKPLMFMPVSIAHEVIPEERSHASELSGAKKEKESTKQLLKLFSLFGRKLGTVHINIGEGIVVEKVTDLKKQTQEVAFECFKAVGAEMPITPSALLALIMLDNSSGALTWKQIISRAEEIINYCSFMGIPLTSSLEDSNHHSSLKIAMNTFINNKKAKLIKREKLGQVFYTISEDSRVHILFHKNMILHHFLVPGIINSTCFNIFNGEITTSLELTKYLMTKRKELKYEFYLPTVKEMIAQALKVVEYAVGEKIDRLEEALDFSSDKLYRLAQRVSPFSTAFSYIYESYYIGALAIKYLGEQSFNMDKYLNISKELFEMEREHGRVVKYPESFSIPNLKMTLKYFQNYQIVEMDNESIKLVDASRLNFLIEKYVKDINDQVALNLKYNIHES